MLKINIEANSLAELKNFVKELNPIEITGHPADGIQLGTPRKIAHKGKGWSEMELNQLVDWYQHTTFTSKEMAVALERPVKGVDQKLYHLRKKGLISRRRSARAKTIN